jgi:hypothetical protein
MKTSHTNALLLYTLGEFSPSQDPGSRWGEYSCDSSGLALMSQRVAPIVVLGCWAFS